MPNATCRVASCDKPVKRRGLCYGHYMKDWRYGTPTPVFTPRWVDVRGQRYGTLTVVTRAGTQWECACDCGRTRLVSAGELNREGDVATCGHRPTHRRTKTAGYTSAHQRCARDRGKVKDHKCVGCGATARHWSYNHDDPDELYATIGNSDRLIAYSLDPFHYSPRCVPCHKRFDLAKIRSTY